MNKDEALLSGESVFPSSICPFSCSCMGRAPSSSSPILKQRGSRKMTKYRRMKPKAGINLGTADVKVLPSVRIDQPKPEMVSISRQLRRTFNLVFHKLDIAILQKNLLLTAEVPFEVEQGKTNNNMEGETNGTQDSGQANVREGNEVGKQGKNKLWVTPGSPNKEIAQN